MRASAHSSKGSAERPTAPRASLLAAVPTAIALALLELAHLLDPLTELAQIGALAAAYRERPVAGIGIVGSLVGLESQPLFALHLEHRALVVGGRSSPLDRGVAPIIVHDRADAAPLGRRRYILRYPSVANVAHRLCRNAVPGRLSPRRRIPPCTVAIPRGGSRTAAARRAARPKGLARPQQAEGGLAVDDGAVDGPGAGLGKRHPVNLDDLGVLLRGLCGREAAREEQMQP